MDLHFRDLDWNDISGRMKSGDDIYAYNDISHPPAGLIGFSGGGYVVLRKWCVVGQMVTWVE